MKRIRFLCFVIFFALFALVAVADDTHADDWGPATNNAQMSIQLNGDKNHLASNQPVVLQMRFRTLSTNNAFWFVSVLDTERDPGFSFLINSPSGKEIFLDGKKNLPSFGSGRAINVSPNQIKELEFDLSRLCKFDEFGTYKIIAKKSIITGMSSKEVLTGCWLTSNPLNITIVPDK
jgi:hypothetical protein